MDGEGLPVSVDVQLVTDGAGSGQPDTDGVAEYSVWAETAVAAPASLPVCGRPGKRRRNGAITAVQHVPERVHRGQRGIIRRPQPGTIHGTVPGDTASDHRPWRSEDNIRYWRVGTHRESLRASSFLRLNVAAEDGSDRLVLCAGTPDTHRFRG